MHWVVCVYVGRAGVQGLRVCATLTAAGRNVPLLSSNLLSPPLPVLLLPLLLLPQVGMTPGWCPSGVNA
jgi:hypothetical protein